MENRHVSLLQGFGGAFLIWISNLDLASWSYVIGMFVALVGLIGSFVWQFRRDKREQAISAATIAALQKGSVTVGNTEELE